MIRIVYLCDVEANKECKKTGCAINGAPCYCRHTKDHTKSKNFKDHEPTDQELSMFFHAVEDSQGFLWWEKDTEDVK